MLDSFRFLTFADKNFRIRTIVLKFSEREEIIVGKEENAGLPAFSSFPTMFSKALSVG